MVSPQTTLERRQDAISSERGNPSAQPPTVTLNSLRKGQCARLQSASLPCGECELLEALGLERQCEFKVCKAGDPCIIKVRSTRIGLSARVARELLVLPTIDAKAQRGAQRDSA
ncbi:MAG: FeoA family protein [Planctomycetota bacterium]